MIFLRRTQHVESFHSYRLFFVSHFDIYNNKCRNASELLRAAEMIGDSDELVYEEDCLQSRGVYVAVFSC